MIRDRPFYPGFRTREAKRANASGLAAMHVGDYERAEMLFRYGLTLQPSAWGMWLNLGNSVGNRGRHREALRHYYHAHSLAPLEHAPRVNAAYAHLMLAEYREGWALYEERWRDGGFHERTSTEVPPGMELEKRWDGVPRAGSTLLVFPEQGAGDVIQMLRYHRELVATGMRLIYRVPDGLYRLARYNLRGAAVTTTGDRLPAHDWHAPFMSLPYLLRQYTPNGAPYLTAPINPHIHALPGTKIGVAWRGNKRHPNDARRSMGFETLAPLLDLPGVSLVSLDHDSNGLHHVPLLDFETTAQVISALDMVITVDTAPAHLAGALGIPALVLLAQPSDWRWGVGGERTGWYNSVTLVRQSIPGDWHTVIACVRDMITTRLLKAA